MMLMLSMNAIGAACVHTLDNMLCPCTKHARTHALCTLHTIFVSTLCYCCFTVYPNSYFNSLHSKSSLSSFSEDSPWSQESER